MRLEEVLTDSFNYVKGFIGNLGRYILLVVLYAIPIVNLIALGYSWRVIEETPKTDTSPPLEGFLGLWVKGLKVAVAGVIYMLIPCVVFMLGLLSVRAGFGFFLFPYALFTGLALSLFLLFLVLSFFFLVFLSMAITHMVKTGRFSKAFSIGEILGVIGRIGWGRYLAWLLVVFVLVAIVAGLNSIPYIGYIISVLVSPLILVFVARSAARLYSEAVKA